MTEGPSITTIIPTYRRPELLARAIQSVLAQTFKNFQLLILDNASGDETREVVAEFTRRDARVVYHRHPQNIGSASNFQYGLHHVTTPFFSFLSDDDVVLPEFYSTAMRAFTDYPVASYVACATLHISPERQLVDIPAVRIPSGLHAPPDGLLTILRFGHTEWTGVLFRRSIVDIVGDLDIDASACFDFDFELRAAARVSFFVSHQAAAVYCVQPLTPKVTGTYPFALLWPAWPRMIRHLTDDPRLPDPIKEEARQILQTRFRDGLFSLILRYLYQNKIDDARQACRVLHHEFKCRWQAGVLQIAIMIHKALGPDRAFSWWSFWRKIFSRAQPRPALIGDITPYLKYLEMPNPLHDKKTD